MLMKKEKKRLIFDSLNGTGAVEAGSGTSSPNRSCSGSTKMMRHLAASPRNTVLNSLILQIWTIFPVYADKFIY
jgi:hypothetical protein